MVAPKFVGALSSSAPLRNTVRVGALPYGFGRKKEVIDEERDEMWKAQQEILKARRQGKTMDGVAERREKARQAAIDKETKRREDRAALARGERPVDDEPYQPYGSEDEGLKGGIIIPLAPFGIPKYDNGERFDLKAPYTDEGWVDEGGDPFQWAKDLFGGKKAAAEKKAAAAKQAAAAEAEAVAAAAEAAKAKTKKKWPWS